MHPNTPQIEESTSKEAKQIIHKRQNILFHRSKQTLKYFIYYKDTKIID